MKSTLPVGNPVTAITCVVGLALVAVGLTLRADQVEMQNGDRYLGKVVSLNAETLVLQSEVLGTMKLPRAKVGVVTLGPVPAASSSRPAAATNKPVQLSGLAFTNTSPDMSASLRELSGSSNLIQQVQSQFLADAGPEANDKFNELLGGLMSGKITISDIRTQAKSAADQMRSLRKELGEEAGPALDGYLAILDKFLAETAAESPLTNALKR